MAVTALLAVPFVGVVDGEGAVSVEVGELLAGQVGRYMIDADRRALVAFTALFGAELAVADVVVGHEARTAVVVLVDVEPRLLGVDDDGVFLLCLHLEQVARHVVVGRPVAIGLEPGDGLLAQVGELVGRCVGRATEARQRPAAGEQQIAPDQVGEPEVRIALDERVDLFEGVGEPAALDVLENRSERRVRVAAGRHRHVACADGEQGQARQQCCEPLPHHLKHRAHQPPTRSCTMTHFPSCNMRLIVLLEEVDKFAER